MTAALFAGLSEDERRELANRLRRAGERFGNEANLLAAAPPAVRAAYHLPREGYHDFYSAAIESSMLSVEVWQRPTFIHTGTGWPL